MLPFKIQTASAVPMTSEVRPSCNTKLPKDCSNSTKEELVEVLLYGDRFNRENNSEFGVLVAITCADEEKVLGVGLESFDRINRAKRNYTIAAVKVVPFGEKLWFSTSERFDVAFACFSQETKDKAIEKIYGMLASLLLDVSDLYTQFSRFLTRSTSLAHANETSKLVIQLSHSSFKLLNNKDEFQVTDEHIRNKIFLVDLKNLISTPGESNRLLNILHVKTNEEISVAKEKYSFITFYFSFLLFGNYNFNIFQKLLDSKFGNGEERVEIENIVSSKSKFDSMVRRGLPFVSCASEETVIHNLETFDWLKWENETEKKTFASFFRRTPIKIKAEEDYLFSVPRRFYEQRLSHPFFHEHACMFTHCLPILRTFSFVPFEHSENVLDDFVLCHSKAIKNALVSFFALEKDPDSILKQIERASRGKGKKFFCFAEHECFQIDLTVFPIRHYNKEGKEEGEKALEASKSTSPEESKTATNEEKKSKNKKKSTTVCKKNSARERLAAKLLQKQDEKEFRFKRKECYFGDENIFTSKVLGVHNEPLDDKLLNFVADNIKFDLKTCFESQEIQCVSKPKEATLGVSFTIGRLLCSPQEVIEAQFVDGCTLY